MTNEEVFDLAEGELSDAQWAMRELCERLPEHHLPEQLEVDVGRLLAKLAQLRSDCAKADYSGSGESESNERIAG